MGLPGMKRIWQQMLDDSHESTYEFTLEVEEKFRNALDSGEVTMESLASPEAFKPPSWDDD